MKFSSNNTGLFNIHLPPQ